MPGLLRGQPAHCVQPAASTQTFQPVKVKARSSYAVPQPVGGNSLGTHPESVLGAPEDFLAAYQAPPGLDASSAGRAARALIDSELPASGALLIQGLPVSTPDEANELVDALAFNTVEYTAFGAPRQKVGGALGAVNLLQAWLRLAARADRQAGLGHNHPC